MKEKGRRKKEKGRFSIVHHPLSTINYFSSFLLRPGDDDDGASQGHQKEQNAAAEQMCAHSKNVSQYHNDFPSTPNTGRPG
jgi:hypothetical protein